VVFDDAHNPLVIYDSKGAPLTYGVRDQLPGHVGGSLALFERLRVGVNLPVVLFAEGQKGTIAQTTCSPPASGALGDLRLAADVRLLGQAGEAFTLAAGARAWLPTRSPEAYGSDGKSRAGPQLVAAGALGAFEYSARVGFMWWQQEFQLDSGSVGSWANAGFAAGVRPRDGKLLVGPEVYAATRATGSQAFKFSEVNTPAEALLGAHYRGNGWRGALGVAKGLNQGFGVPAYRVVASLEWAPASEVKDANGDGIQDWQDACPQVAGVASPVSARRGCPLDGDEDGIPDADKRFHGCPEKKDVDTDEVPDREDACLKEPGKRNADPKKNGCPVGAVVNGQLVLDQVKFKTNSDVVPKESDGTLTKVLEAINKLPATNRYRVEGHTDTQGKPAYNKGLSERRAKSVVAWLAKRGLDPKRFEALGVGQEKPIATNDTAEGRQANRRVEIHILEGTQPLPAQPVPAK